MGAVKHRCPSSSRINLGGQISQKIKSLLNKSSDQFLLNHELHEMNQSIIEQSRWRSG